MLSPRNKPSRTSLFVFVMIIVSPVLYVLSYAPAIRIFCEPPPVDRMQSRPSLGPGQLRGVDAHPLAMYRPVEYLVDCTPLREPLFAWASLWHVDLDMKASYCQRTGRTDFSPDVNPR